MRRARRASGSSPIHFSCLVLLLFPVLMAACGEPLATQEPVYLQATGSMAMSPLVTDLAAAFSSQSTAVHLDVTGLGTQFGLEALRADRADVALASWLPPDLDPDWRTVAIARDGIAIIVHPTNPVNELGLLQLRDLFGGRTYEWKGAGRQTSQGQVQPVSREEGSGTRAAFEALVMDEWPLTPLAVVAPSSQAVVEYVAENPEAIGYVSMGTVSSEVKVLRVEGEVPTAGSAGQGSYPLTRELWLITADPPAKAVQAFLDYVLGPAGQEIVGRHFGRIR